MMTRCNKSLLFYVCWAVFVWLCCWVTAPWITSTAGWTSERRRRRHSGVIVSPLTSLERHQLSLSQRDEDLTRLAGWERPLPSCQGATRRNKTWWLWQIPLLPRLVLCHGASSFTSVKVAKNRKGIPAGYKNRADTLLLHVKPTRWKSSSES